MDPISVALLTALAGGTGGELGRQAWVGLTALVRRPLGLGREEADRAPEVASGQHELDRLVESPADAARAQALSATLAARATADAEFSAGLQQWHEQASLVRTGDGDVHNTISGGTFLGPAVQGRDFSGLTFTTTAPPPAPDGGPRSAQR